MSNDFFLVALPPLCFLTESGRYNLADQRASSTSDHGFLLFESPTLHILFGREHGSFWLDIACASDPTDDHWYDLPLIRLLLDGVREDQLVYSDSLAASLPFASADSAATELRQYLSRMEEAFAPHRLRETEASLDALRDYRNQIVTLYFNSKDPDEGE